MKASDLYGSTTLSAADLSNGPIEVTIESVEVKRFEKNGELEKPKPLLHFVGCKKGLSVNATNAGMLIDNVADDMDMWVGVKIKLGTAPTTMGNRRVLGVRILEVLEVPAAGSAKPENGEVKNGEAEKLPPRSGRGKAGTPAA